MALQDWLNKIFQRQSTIVPAKIPDVSNASIDINIPEGAVIPEQKSLLQPQSQKIDWKSILKESLPYIAIAAYGAKDPIAGASAMDRWQQIQEQKKLQELQAEQIKREKERQEFEQRLAKEKLDLEKQKLAQNFLTGYDPSQYTKGFSKDNPWVAYLSNPANFKTRQELADAYQQAVAWERDKADEVLRRELMAAKPAALKDPTIENLKWQYAQENKGRYDPYTGEFVFPPGVTPMPFEQWLEMNKPAQTVQYVQSKFGGTQEQFTPTPRYKSGKVPTAQKGKFGEVHALRADKLVERYGGVGRALMAILAEPDIDRAVKEALVYRYNENERRRTGKNPNWTLDDWAIAQQKGWSVPHSTPVKR